MNNNHKNAPNKQKPKQTTQTQSLLAGSCCISQDFCLQGVFHYVCASMRSEKKDMSGITLFSCIGCNNMLLSELWFTIIVNILQLK